MKGLLNLSQMSHEDKDGLILELLERVQRLEQRLALNSANSSKPPSSDGYRKPSPKSQRPLGQRTTGGQKGHPGHTLRQSQHVHQVIIHAPVLRCSACQSLLPAGRVIDKRQVFELPAVQAQIIEHQLLASTCACGQGHTGQWPRGVHAPVQYGARAKALVVHLNQHHLVPTARTSALMQDIFGLAISQASITGFAAQAANVLAPTVASIGQAVQASAVVHADETGIRVNNTLQWLHCAVTDTLSWLARHTQRGKLAFTALGILPGVRGVLVHDGLAGYRQFDCVHSLCNAHHIRELVGVHEQGEHMWDDWPVQMIDLLVQAKGEVLQRAGPLERERQAWFDQRWQALLERAEALNPPNLQERGPGSGKGRRKHSKAANLLKRLRQYKQDVWRFMTHPGVPFTNNLAEQALRMSKIKQRVSGCFRSEVGADAFFTIRSYLATMHKQKQCLFDCLISVFEGRPMQPVLA